jgi:hypothetical protein
MHERYAKEPTLEDLRTARAMLDSWRAVVVPILHERRDG